MIALDNVSKGYAGRALFEGVSLRLVAGDRVGIVGPNGAGKSTLLSLLCGGEQPDTGAVIRPRQLAVGILRQELMARSDLSPLATALQTEGRLAEIEHDLAALPEALAATDDPAEQARISTRLAEAHALHRDLGGGDREARARRILSGLGFRPGTEDRPLSAFSGGYVMRAELARLLVDPPDVLLLDEPTNHLDLESVLWLQGHLLTSRSILVIISHDRAFLTATARQIIEIEDKRVTRYAGNYEDYVREKAARREQLEAQARTQDQRMRETERFIERFRSKASKARQVQSRIKALAREERITLDRDRRGVHFRFPQPERTSATAISLEGVTKSYGATPVYRGMDFVLKRGEKVVLVGPNGAGKSTLLRLLAGAITPDAGKRSVGDRVSIGYYTQHRHDMLDLTASVLDNAMGASRQQSETFIRSLLGAFLFSGDDVKKSAAVLSGGEKSRLGLAMILLDPPSVLLMDEPTIHLDIPSVDALTRALIAYEGSLCFVSHDVHFIAQVARRVVRVESGALTEYPGDWAYYLWKQPGGEAKGVATDSPASGSNVVSPVREGRREERRRAAEARSELARRTRPTRREIAQLEATIEDLERERAGLEAELADPDLYSGSGADVGRLGQRHAETARALDQAMARWTQLSSELEAEEQAFHGHGDGDLDSMEDA